MYICLYAYIVYLESYFIAFKVVVKILSSIPNGYTSIVFWLKYGNSLLLLSRIDFPLACPGYKAGIFGQFPI